MVDNWHFGNAHVDGEDHRGWIVGHFLDDPDGIRTSKDVEIKWAMHRAGEERENWQDTEHRTTVLLLIKGKFRVNLSIDSFLLEDQGDYAMWGPGIGHSWKAEEESLLMTIRWPSTPH